MTWLLILGLVMVVFSMTRIAMHIIVFGLQVLALYAAFVIAALFTAFLCVGSDQHGEFVRAVIIGLTGGS